MNCGTGLSPSSSSEPLCTSRTARSASSVTRREGGYNRKTPHNVGVSLESIPQIYFIMEPKSATSGKKRRATIRFAALVIYALAVCTLFFTARPAFASSSIPPENQTVQANHTVGQVAPRPYDNGNAGGMFYTEGEIFQAVSLPLEKRGNPAAMPFIVRISEGSYASSTTLGTTIATSSAVLGSTIFDNRYATSSDEQTYTVFHFASPVVLSEGYYYIEVMRSDYGFNGSNYITTRKLVATSTYNRADAWSSRVGADSIADEQWFSADLLWFSGSSTPGEYTDTLDPEYSGATRIVDFTPADGAVLPALTPVTFTLHAYVAEEDIGTFIGVRFTFHNIDQNVFLLSMLSQSSFYMLNGFQATTSGDFYFTSDPYALGEGNYRVEAQLERTYFGGLVTNVFAPISDSQSHQFTVGSSTFIGNLSQTMYTDVQEFLTGKAATSSLTSAADCNPLGFDTIGCLAYLFSPSSQDVGNTILGLKDYVLVRFPWGYPTRFIAILSDPATTSLPSFTTTLHIGPGSETPATTTLTFDMDDMLEGGAALAASIEDVTNGKTAREIGEPMIKLAVALSVVLVIVHDVMGMKHEGGGGSARITRRRYDEA